MVNEIFNKQMFHYILTSQFILERTLANSNKHGDSTNSVDGEMFDKSGMPHYSGKIHLEETTISGLKNSR